MITIEKVMKNIAFLIKCPQNSPFKQKSTLSVQWPSPLAMLGDEMDVLFQNMIGVNQNYRKGKSPVQPFKASRHSNPDLIEFH